MIVVNLFSNFRLRLQRASGDKKLIDVYVKKARRRMINRTCAEMWALGVPWAEALDLSTKAFATADAVARPVAKGNRKGGGKKGKGRGKGKGKQ